MKKNKICVYTCITGNYDNLKEIEKEKGIDYYCFTNNKNIVSKTWNVIYIEDSKLSNVKLARKIKILGHDLINDYDILLWMDAAVVFKKKIKNFIDSYLNDEVFVAFKHGIRNNIKEECFECVKFGKETKENVKVLLDFYEKEKFNDTYGLIESTVFIKKPKDKIVKETMKLWFDMILKYSHRDQLSFNYCISKTGLKVKWIEEKVFNNKWFNWIKHNGNREIKKYRVYFGDEDNYNLDNDVQGEYMINNNKYIINTTVPCNCNRLIICPCHVIGVNFSNLKINGKIINDLEMKSSFKYKESYIFYDENPFLIISKKFNRNSKISIEIEMNIMNDIQLSEFTYFLANQNNLVKEELNKKNNELISLNNSLNEILNSRGYKILNFITKIVKH